MIMFKDKPVYKLKVKGFTQESIHITCNFNILSTLCNTSYVIYYTKTAHFKENVYQTTLVYKTKKFRVTNTEMDSTLQWF